MTPDAELFLGALRAMCLIPGEGRSEPEEIRYYVGYASGFKEPPGRCDPEAQDPYTRGYAQGQWARCAYDVIIKEESGHAPLG